MTQNGRLAAFTHLDVLDFGESCDNGKIGKGAPSWRLTSLKQGTVGPCTLDGRFVKLEPLRYEHADALLQASKNTDWEWFLGPLRSSDAVLQRIEVGLKGEERDEQYAFAVILKEEARVVGSTSYLSVASKHLRLEIGSTWYSQNVWGTAINPESKLLLMRHAFED
jgi:RimJ/RimL family protein N-acetyltransferase